MNSAANQFPIRVLKLGGSLLPLPDLSHRLAKWLEQQTECINVVVVGGGNRVKTLRADQERIGLTDPKAHFAAIEIMRENSLRFKSQFEEDSNFSALMFAELATVSREAMRKPPQTGPWFFDPSEWSRGNVTLPRDWRTSSDSLTAAVAVELKAAEVVLCKSVPPLRQDWEENASAGFVDSEFPQWVSLVPVCRIVNFRCPNFSEYSAQFTKRELC